MSIIQEALKKAQVDLKKSGSAAGQKTLHPVSGSAEKAGPARKRSVLRLTPVMFAAVSGSILIAASVLATIYFGHVARTVKAADMQRSPSPSQNEDGNNLQPASGPAASQDVTYAPLGASGVSGASTAALLTAKTPELHLSGIMYTEELPRAIINDRIVQAGDVVSGAKVKNIGPKSAVLEFGDTEITLNIK